MLCAYIQGSVIHIGIVCQCQDGCDISGLTLAHQTSHLQIAVEIRSAVSAGRQSHAGPVKQAGSTASNTDSDRVQADRFTTIDQSTNVTVNTHATVT